MLYVHAYQYAVIVQHVFLHTTTSTVQYSGRNRSAKHHVLKQLKQFPIFKKQGVYPSSQ